MTSKIKAIGLAAFAIAAMSMIAVSAAQAGAAEVHVTNTPGKAVITAEQVVQHVLTLTVPGQKITCTQALAEGTIADGGTGPQTTVTEATITAQYTGCQIQAPVLAAAEVRMNGCKYTFTGSANALTANVDITGCTSGKHIEIIGGGCTVTVKEQGTSATPLSHVTFTNEGSSESQDVLAQITVQGIQYQTEGLFCILGQAQRSDGDYTGTSTAKAFVDPVTTTQTTHNGHQFQKLNKGNQRGLFAT